MPRRQLAIAPVWKDERLEEDLKKAIDIFREERMREPLEAYLDQFEEYKDAFDQLLEATVDLTQLSERAIEILGDTKLQDALRYLAGPPISLDDLKTLTSASLSLTRLKADPAMAQRIIETVLLGLDRRRFPWVADGREATQAERASAVLASTALIASQKVATARRTEGKTAQEDLTKDVLRRAGFREVPSRDMQTLHQAPQLGEFCGESSFGGRKADIVVRLWDSRVMPVECKVSNSATNSIKRLNNDAAVKAVQWIEKFGTNGVVPTALLSGVYKLRNLQDAQSKGLALFWAHDLAAMLEWIEATRRER